MLRKSSVTRKGYLFFLAAVLTIGLKCDQLGNTCYSTGGIVDECFMGWTPEECQNWNNLQVNGATWKSSILGCYDLGFTVQCSATQYTYSSADCP